MLDKTALSAALMMWAWTADAGLIRLEAAYEGAGTLTGFEIVFDDTGDGLLQWDEIASFSGILIGTGTFFVDAVVVVPTIAGISTFSFAPDLATTPADRWRFEAPSGSAFSCGSATTQCWDYTLTSVAVAAPATFALVGLGLATLAHGRTRRRLEPRRLLGNVVGGSVEALVQ